MVENTHDGSEIAVDGHKQYDGSEKADGGHNGEVIARVLQTNGEFEPTRALKPQTLMKAKKSMK
eukprot:3226145-Heterocapsa_arctica.AAC.1